MTTRLKYQIISVDGDEKQETINEFVDNRFLSLDTREFRKYIKSVTPDIDFTQEYTSQIGETHKVNIPIGVRFFFELTPKYKKVIHEEIFSLCYYGQGGFQIMIYTLCLYIYANFISNN